jgi:hypothetical protein
MRASAPGTVRFRLTTRIVGVDLIKAVEIHRAPLLHCPKLPKTSFGDPLVASARAPAGLPKARSRAVAEGGAAVPDRGWGDELLAGSPCRAVPSSGRGEEPELVAIAAVVRLQGRAGHRFGGLPSGAFFFTYWPTRAFPEGSSGVTPPRCGVVLDQVVADVQSRTQVGDG